jgi:hypothetical protein
MRQNKILSGIEQSQKAANARAHYASGLVAPPVARALAQPAPVVDVDDAPVQAKGGLQGLAENLAAEARAKGFSANKPLKIVFIKDAAGEIVGARIG